MFQKGHKFAKGGLRNPPGGRPTKEQIFKRELEREAFIREAFRDGAEMGRHYRRQALEDNTILRDYRAALVGKNDEDGSEQQARPIYFVQFNNLSQAGAPTKEIIASAEGGERAAIEAQVWAQPNVKLIK